jgi:hypothetical protein
MAQSWEAEFMALWRAGVDTAAIAKQLGIPQGTVSSRAHTLQRQGKIEPRPRGGARNPRVAQARQAGSSTPPVQRPVQTIDTGAVQSVDTGAVQPFDTGPVQALGADVEQLKAEVAGLRQLVQSVVDRLDHPPVQTPVQITALPPYPPGKAVRWNLWILDAIRDELSAWAAEREVSPSQLVQELLWKALSDRRVPTS